MEVGEIYINIDDNLYYLNIIKILKTKLQGYNLIKVKDSYGEEFKIWEPMILQEYFIKPKPKPKQLTLENLWE